MGQEDRVNYKLLLRSTADSVQSLNAELDEAEASGAVSDGSTQVCALHTALRFYFSFRVRTRGPFRMRWLRSFGKPVRVCGLRWLTLKQATTPGSML